MVIRWLKFNAVGMLGAVVQLASLWLLVRFGTHYLVATAIAVELAVLHNYAWHVRWTWADRTNPSIWRFHLANGIVSIISNLLVMRMLTGSFDIPAVPANLMAIGITSLVNFMLGDRWVFVSGTPNTATPAAGDTSEN